MHAGFGIGKDDQFAAARAHFHEVRLQLLEQVGIRSHGNHRHVVIDKREGAVLELTGSIGLGMDVRDFLELERPFHRNRVHSAATQKQRMVLWYETLRQLADHRIERQRFFHHAGQFNQAANQCVLLFGARSVGFSQGDHQHAKGHQLGGERFGRGNTDFRARTREHHELRLAHERALGHVTDGERTQIARLFSQTQCRQGVGGFARLADRHEQRIFRNDRITIAIFARDLDRTRNLGELLDQIVSDIACVITRAAGDNVHVLCLGEHFASRRAKRGFEQAAVGNALL